MWKLKIAEGGGSEWVTTTNGHVGRQYWEFDAEAGTLEERAQVEKMRDEFKKNRFQFRQSADLLMRMQLTKDNPPRGPIPGAVKINENEDITEEAVTTTLRRGISYFSCIQAHDGHWPSESSGLLFLMPSLVIVLSVTGQIEDVLSPEHQKEIKRYIYNHQNEDGGWGTYIEGHSSVFGSVLSYTTLRLLGEGPDDGEECAMARGRKWILDHGGAIGMPSWGKFWLAILGAYEWDGCNPMPPECWFLPNFSPVHPGKMLCHCRLVYLPMSYLYGKRFVGPVTELVESLRQEIYTQPYYKIKWNKTRNTCAKEDLLYPHPFIQDVLWGFLSYGEQVLTRWPFSALRDKALRTAMEHIHYEEENTRYLCAAYVEKVLSLLACWVEDPYSEANKYHIARIPDFLWMAEDGMKIQGVAGSQTWDVAFALQSILSADLAEEYGPTLKKAHNFLKASQVQENPSGNFRTMYRHVCKGSWIFSTRDQGWQVSDCTAEALKAALLLSQMPPELVGEGIVTERLYDAVNIILSLQSTSGGFTVWEPERAQWWVEKLNPTEFLENIVIEKDFVECTSSAVQALILFKKLHPGHRRKEIESCISRAIQYMENLQEPDGSWFGSWGICYTYATWLAVEGLVACGKNYDSSPVVRKACEFLLSKQLADGGWGESYLSSINKVYTPLEGNRSTLVQTSWALLALICAGQAEIDPLPIHRGMRLLINAQMADGNFPQQDIAGLFFKNGILQYGAYRNIFPIWALGVYRRLVSRP